MVCDCDCDHLWGPLLSFYIKWNLKSRRVLSCIGFFSVNYHVQIMSYSSKFLSQVNIAAFSLLSLKTLSFFHQLKIMHFLCCNPDTTYWYHLFTGHTNVEKLLQKASHNCFHVKLASLASIPPLLVYPYWNICFYFILVYNLIFKIQNGRV